MPFFCKFSHPVTIYPPFVLKRVELISFLPPPAQKPRQSDSSPSAKPPFSNRLGWQKLSSFEFYPSIGSFLFRFPWLALRPLPSKIYPYLTPFPTPQPPIPFLPRRICAPNNFPEKKDFQPAPRPDPHDYSSQSQKKRNPPPFCLAFPSPDSAREEIPEETTGEGKNPLPSGSRILPEKDS